MRAYGDILQELVELPQQLTRQQAAFEQAIAAEQRKREAEIESYTAEHQAMLDKLAALLQRARAEGITIGSADGNAGELSSDPVQYASQLVSRLEEALDHILHTREALVEEERRLGEEERRRAEEERRRREAGEQGRQRQWENAREGSVWLAAALAIEAVAAAVAGATGSVAAIAVVPLLAAAIGVALARQLPSIVPARAVWRASGTMPSTPVAPEREAWLGALAYGGVCAGLAGLLAASVGIATGASGAGVGALMAALGLLTVGVIWMVLPRRG